VDEGLAAAVGLFEEAIAWLQDHYSKFEFWVERDLVWTVQSRLGQVIKERGPAAPTPLPESDTIWSSGAITRSPLNVFKSPLGHPVVSPSLRGSEHA
jgi:hypothetical protein